MTEQDLYLLLVRKLSLYDTLLEQLQTGFQNGFNQLSRANYYNKDSLRGSYGQDYWDETFVGTRFVKITVTHKIEELECPGSPEEDTVDEKEQSEQVRRRNERKKLVEKVKKDPLYMFGGSLSVPVSLRQSQSSFKSTIPVMYQLIELRDEISSLVDRLERMS